MNDKLQPTDDTCVLISSADYYLYQSLVNSQNNTSSNNCVLNGSTDQSSNGSLVRQPPVKRYENYTSFKEGSGQEEGAEKNYEKKKKKRGRKKKLNWRRY